MKAVFHGVILSLVLGGVAVAQVGSHIIPVAPNVLALEARLSAVEKQNAILQQQLNETSTNVALLTNQELNLSKAMTGQTVALNNRISDLDQRFKTHTHGYSYDRVQWGDVNAGGAIASRIFGSKSEQAETGPPK